MMANPFSVLNKPQGYDFDSIRQAYGMLRGQDPRALISRMASNDPRMAQIESALRRGADPKGLFYELCSQRGIDPREFLRQITGK